MLLQHNLAHPDRHPLLPRPGLSHKVPLLTYPLPLGEAQPAMRSQNALPIPPHAMPMLLVLPEQLPPCGILNLFGRWGTHSHLDGLLGGSLSLLTLIRATFAEHLLCTKQCAKYFTYSISRGEWGGYHMPSIQEGIHRLNNYSRIVSAGCATCHASPWPLTLL